MAWDRKVAWITGGPSGIGEALAGSLSARGAEVLISSRRTEALEALRKTLPGPSLVPPSDVTEIAGLPDHAERALHRRDRSDLLVNNAGVIRQR